MRLSSQPLGLNLLIASIMLFSTAAWAAPAAETDADSAARRSAAPGSKVSAVYDFEQDQVDGDSLKPDHERIPGRVAQKHESMIKLRSHFIPQMLQMANDV